MSAKKTGLSAVSGSLFVIITLFLLQVSFSWSNPTATENERIGNSDTTGVTHRMLSDKGNKYNIVKKQDPQEKGIERYLLEYTGSNSHYPEDNNENPIIKKLLMTVEHHHPTQLRVKISDELESRWEVPNEYPFPHFRQNPSDSGDSDYEFIVQEEPFGFAVIRKATDEVIFDTRQHNLIYSDLSLDFSSSIPTDNLFGLGERSSRFKMGPSGTYTIWARDKPEVIDYGVTGGHVYGHHPVYLMKEKKGNWHVVLFRSSNAMDVTMDRGQSVRFRVAGGIIDVVLFLGGDTPESAIEQYHDYIGHWALMPFWSLGNHQSRWGYTHLTTLKEKVRRFREIDAPIDVIWSDLDYMIDKEDFTINSQKFPYDEFNSWLKDGKIRWVPIIDAGVSRKYRHEQGYDEGIRRDVFIKNKDGGVMLGTVWPGESHYVDWFHPKAEGYWADMLERTYSNVKFAGIWLDMNEPTNFANGEVGKEWEMSKFDRLPYTPGGQPLKTMTISMDGQHYGGILEFDVHDLFGTLESKATYQFLKKKTPLPFILTRSSAFGAGQFAAHWTGDNGASWEFMRYGTTGVFQFGIFGMPFTGADICGFMRSTTPELCARWYQAGMLYPFARNHNHLEARDQEPYAFNEAYTQETAVKAIQLRYSILKWYYAQFVEKKGRGLVFKPLFYEFPNDEALYKTDTYFTDEQIMLGKSLMAVPVYQPNKETYPAHFPPARWFNYFTGEIIHDSFETGKTTEIPAPLGDYVPMFIRGGTIVHKQEIKGVQWTEDLDNKFQLVVAFNRSQDSDEKFDAKGFMMGLNSFSDTAVVEKCVEKNCFIDITATAERIPKQKSIKIKIEFHARERGSRLDEQRITSIAMYGLPNGKVDREFAGFYRITGMGLRESPRIANLDYRVKGGLTFQENEIIAKDGTSLEIVIEEATE